MAIEATSIFLNDVRSAVGDDNFAKFLNLKSENSMALVIDVSGSMSGESSSCNQGFHDTFRMSSSTTVQTIDRLPDQASGMTLLFLKN